jgi:hypothetical protein
MIAGKYFITPHAVHRFILRICPYMDYNQALAAIIKSIDICNNVPTLTEKYNAHYLRVDTLHRFVAVIENEVVATILVYKEKFNQRLKRWHKWKLSELYYLKINYGLKTYKEMQKEMLQYHSIKAISNKAVSLNVSNKRNWHPIESIIALYYTDKKLTNRSINSQKIKKCRLIKSISN